MQFSLHPALCLFGTQQQLTHPPVTSSTLPLRKMTVFQGVAPWHTIFTSSCVIPLWDSTTAHSPSGKELNTSSQEDANISGCYTLPCKFHFILRNPSLGLSDSSLTLRERTLLFPFERIMFLRTCCCVMFSYYPNWALFNLILTHIT